MLNSVLFHQVWCRELWAFFVDDGPGSDLNMGGVFTLDMTRGLSRLLVALFVVVAAATDIVVSIIIPQSAFAHAGPSPIHISEATRLLSISYAVFGLKKKSKRLSIIQISAPTRPY